MSETGGKVFDGFRRNEMAFRISRDTALVFGLAEPTPAEKAARNAAAAAWRDYHGRRRQADRDMVAALAGLGDRTVDAVLDLHAPTAGEYPTCNGDDYSGPEADPPDWPCATVLAVARVHGVPTREDVKR
ncbi:hypothetical protein [Cellulomonas shaoxiangyii]|uniref:Uncharacterized protein n=1 Tax=Cellulomonas shaoxiangyii TaxID=2566013 RepID=A0A4P7SH19_9CELL|nr:hypothetical protein [Cellulomonas shaoxiangyii]QCB93312.1 hypothetical protein E5225_06870 [Cellulomonas shaoxiangyii]TGY79417.1 hypothetical protein E5226_15400 [Cellulomonas shaoxiangyii]